MPKKNIEKMRKSFEKSFKRKVVKSVKAAIKKPRTGHKSLSWFCWLQVNKHLCTLFIPPSHVTQEDLTSLAAENKSSAAHMNVCINGPGSFTISSTSEHMDYYFHPTIKMQFCVLKAWRTQELSKHRVCLKEPRTAHSSAETQSSCIELHSSVTVTVSVSYSYS